MGSWALRLAPRFGIKTAFRLVSIACAAWALAGCSPERGKVPYYNGPDFTPLWAGESDFSTYTLHTIAAFEFTDQNGNKVGNETFRGKIYVADFFFTVCPGICPKLTANMGKVAEAFKDKPDVLFISHSVTPEADSVPRLKEYAENHGIRSTQWRLVTGKQSEIYGLARQSYFAEREMGFKDSSSKDFLHTEHFILVDREGHIRGIYNGTLELEADRLIEDIRFLTE